ncbi:hypothetical protein SYNPS1DRAFT_23106 [Syncephalis pseudoplumigaleata]|uniref:Uncharacterized protein n=1 Tax=Syncephalis pseudoplumigaleata TaxID=1712513 RepID=A0A4P9YXQ6_9FUNG|nr:hypothetical protein SYNPS1DRAFT_23106 [Syncephalis pseudoplumigaleata]|eukprot:RKP24847.1 hypothetical protein SYNPS1DRAFT_23106 [Syncephalis pseudoplumigaleata]
MKATSTLCLTASAILALTAIAAVQAYPADPSSFMPPGFPSPDNFKKTAETFSPTNFMPGGQQGNGSPFSPANFMPGGQQGNGFPFSPANFMPGSQQSKDAPLKRRSKDDDDDDDKDKRGKQERKPNRTQPWRHGRWRQPSTQPTQPPQDKDDGWSRAMGNSKLNAQQDLKPEQEGVFWGRRL